MRTLRQHPASTLGRRMGVLVLALDHLEGRRMIGRAAYIRPRLARAADLIERVGLHQGDFWPGAEDNGGRGIYREGDSVSVVGALLLQNATSEALGASVWLGKQIGEPNIQLWSDRPEQITESVVATIREVIA